MDFSSLTELDYSELISDRLLANFAIKLNLVDQSCLAGMTIPQQIDAVEKELKTNPHFASVIAHAFNMHLMTFLTSAALKLTKKSLERGFK